MPVQDRHDIFILMNMLYKIILDLKKEQECVGDVTGAAFEHPLASTLLSTGVGVMEDSVDPIATLQGDNVHRGCNQGKAFPFLSYFIFSQL